MGSVARGATGVAPRFGLGGWRLQRRLWPGAGVAVVIAVWAGGHRYSSYLPSPGEVWGESTGLLAQQDTYYQVWVSLRRLLAGLGFGYLAAFFVTLFMRISRWWEVFFSTYVFIALTIPSLAMALVSLMIFGLSEVGVYFAVGVVVFPFVVIGLNAGFKNLDANLADMAKVYQFSWWVRIRHVAIPDMAPHMFSAFRSAHALAWKLVIVTEVFSQRNGIGYQYAQAFRFLELTELIAWLLFLLIAVFAVEYGALRPLERRSTRWRPS